MRNERSLVLKLKCYKKRQNKQKNILGYSKQIIIKQHQEKQLK